VIVGAAMSALPGIASAATICSNQNATTGGSYYQMWSAGTGSACMTMNSATNYSTTWSGIGDFVAGVGWNPGSNHTVNFTSSLNATGGTSLVSLYGWSTSPLVEYYVMENYKGSPPTAGTFKGTVTSDGGTYDIYEHQQVNQPSIQGTTTTLSAGSSGSNWYNLNVAVAGSTTWTATVNFVAPAVDFATWNVNATFSSQYVMIVKPNGNNWGMTVTPNGQFTWPSVSCSTG
jgi:hypothetical protein